MVTRGGGRRGGGEKSKEVDGGRDIGSPDRRDPIAASNHQVCVCISREVPLSPWLACDIKD